MMFGKQVGNYSWRSIFRYLFPHRDSVDGLNEFLPPNENQYFFPSGRQAIYTIIRHLQGQSGNSISVALPAWSCSILPSLLEHCKVTLLPIRVNAPEMKMDVAEIIAARPDVIILVSENGLLYPPEEVAKLKDAGILTIGDHCLALRNYSGIGELPCDYHIFSGGFSKPISSFGLGIASTNHTLPVENRFHKRFSLKAVFLAFVHLLIQNPQWYPLFRKLIGEPGLEIFYPARSHGASLRCISVLLEELRQFRKDRPAYMKLQNEICKILQGPAPSSLLSKIVVPKETVQPDPSIHFHCQYPWTAGWEGDIEIKENLQKIHSEYISFAINRSCLRYSDQFIQALKQSVTHASD